MTDPDLLAAAHVSRFVDALRDDYYVPEERIRDAVSRRGSFNLIHLDTMLKVDVFVSRDRPFRSAPRRTPSWPSSSGTGAARRCPNGSGAT